MRFDEKQIAEVCHNTNKEYCRSIGDFSQPDWDNAPEWQVNSAIAGVRFHLSHPNAGPEASHDAWLAQKVDEGWVYGPVKNPVKKEHPCILPFADLPKEQQAKDYIFRAIVHAMARLKDWHE